METTMRKLLTFFIALAVTVGVSVSSFGGSMGLLGVGGASSAPTYQGPGDFLTYSAAYGLRAFSAATRGNKLINVCNSTGGVDVGCGDLVSNAVTGTLVSATVSGITCPGANCTIKTFYDLTGNGNDATQSTVASRHTLPAFGTCTVISASVACAVSQGNRYLTSTTPTWSLPVFYTSSAQVLTNGTAILQIMSSNDASVSASLFYKGSNTPQITGTGGVGGPPNSITGTASQTAPHGIGGVANSGASAAYLDVEGTVTTATISTNPPGSVAISLNGDPYSQNLPSGSYFLEAGVGFSSPASTVMNAQLSSAKTYWGY
jgi:hypothetical protein